MDNEKTKLNVPSQSAYIYLHVLSTGISHYVPLCVLILLCLSNVCVHVHEGAYVHIEVCLVHNLYDISALSFELI